MFSSLIGFFIVITVIVTIHEFGHYLAARSVGVRVTEFSVGFGPAILSFKDRIGTIWKLCFIPLGGYVKMYGDLGIASTQKINPLKKLPKSVQNQTFSMKSPLQRGYIAAAGPFSNYLLSFLILFYFNFSHGRLMIDNSVSSVQENSPAYLSGIKSGDRIISVNGVSTQTFDKIYNQISLLPNTSVNLTIERNGLNLKKTLMTSSREYKDKKGRVLGKIGVIGVAASTPEIIDVGLLSASYYTIDDLYTISSLTFKALKQIFTGERSVSELRGAITIADISGEKLYSGLESFVLFVAMISINIGFVNLMPIPVLDGGHIMFCVYEMITSRRPSDFVQSVLNKIGLAIIIFMFVISTSNDIKALLF